MRKQDERGHGLPRLGGANGMLICCSVLHRRTIGARFVGCIHGVGVIYLQNKFVLFILKLYNILSNSEINLIKF